MAFWRPMTSRAREMLRESQRRYGEEQGFQEFFATEFEPEAEEEEEEPEEEVEAEDKTQEREGCPICQEPFKNAMVARCGHAVCKTCLGKLNGKDTVRCPLCRTSARRDAYYPCHALNADAAPKPASTAGLRTDRERVIAQAYKGALEQIKHAATRGDAQLYMSKATETQSGYLNAQVWTLLDEFREKLGENGFAIHVYKSLGETFLAVTWP